jgi:hypothetical protein
MQLPSRRAGGGAHVMSNADHASSGFHSPSVGASWLMKTPRFLCWDFAVNVRFLIALHYYAEVRSTAGLG